jgi:hypothetical protein
VYWRVGQGNKGPDEFGAWLSICEASLLELLAKLDVP